MLRQVAHVVYCLQSLMAPTQATRAARIRALCIVTGGCVGVYVCVRVGVQAGAGGMVCCRFDGRHCSSATKSAHIALQHAATQGKSCWTTVCQRRQLCHRNSICSLISPQPLLITAPNKHAALRSEPAQLNNTEHNAGLAESCLLSRPAPELEWLYSSNES